MERCDGTGKRIYQTHKEAMDFIKGKTTKRIYHRVTGQRINRRVAKRKEQRAYYCEYCGNYHVTSIAHEAIMGNRNNGKRQNRNTQGTKNLAGNYSWS